MYLVVMKDEAVHLRFHSTMSGEEPVLPSPLPILFALIVAAGPLCAELLHVEQPVGGLDCVSCAQSVDKTLKKIKGVETATFRIADAVAVLEMKPGNNTALEEIRDAVKRIGYTPKEAKLTVRGEPAQEDGKWILRVGAVQYPLDVSSASDKAPLSADGVVIVEGSI